MITILYADQDIIVCIKPARVLSTDEPGGMPELLRKALDNPKADIRTVHRLDRVVSGLMVLARSAQAASELSRQIREDRFEKEYLAVVHGAPEATEGRLCDLLVRDKARKMTMVAAEPGKGVQEASLRYKVLQRAEGMSRVRIALETGRTHQIRVHMQSLGHPVVGDRKYGHGNEYSPIDRLCLHAKVLEFIHPMTEKKVRFETSMPREFRADNE